MIRRLGMLTAFAFACAVAPDAGDDVGALVTRIDALTSKIQTLSASFRQVRHSALLRRPLESSGTVRLTRTIVRWDTELPFPSAATIDSSGVRIYYPQQNLLEAYDLDQRLARFIANPIPRLGELRPHFAIEQITPSEEERAIADHLVVLRLTPLTAELAEHVQEIRMVFDLQSGLMKRARVTDAGGESTTITFHDIELGRPLRDEDLVLRVPEGTRLVHPQRTP